MSRFFVSHGRVAQIQRTSGRLARDRGIPYDVNAPLQFKSGWRERDGELRNGGESLLDVAERIEVENRRQRLMRGSRA